MTNQDYMDLLKRFACGESTTEMKVEYIEDNDQRDMMLRYFVNTHVYDCNHIEGGTRGCNVIEIRNNELIMLMPNVMDAYLTCKYTTGEIVNLYRDNAELLKVGTSLPNQHSGAKLGIPYYKDDAERFQRELMGEFVLYESHLQYVHKIIQDAHDAYANKIRDTWDKAIIL